MKLCAIASVERVFTYYLNPQMKKLCENGYDITVCCDFSAEYLKEYGEHFRCEPIKISRQVSLINMLICIYKLFKLFKKEKFDIIQYTGPSTSLICSIAGCLAGIKKRLYCQWGIRYTGFSGIKRRIFKALEILSCKLSTNILLDSPGNLMFCVNEGLFKREKANVIYNGSVDGIDLSIYDYNQKNEFRRKIRTLYNVDEDIFVVGYLGRLLRDKGINELFDALKVFLPFHDDVKVMLVGFQEAADPVDKTLMEWAKAQDNIIFCGPTNKPQEFYAAFDLFVFPSYREGYGGGVIQAAAFGIPAAVSNIPSLLDSIDNGNCGISFPPKNAKVITEALEYMYTQEYERNLMGENARQRIISSFNMLNWLDKYFEYVRNI